MRRTLRSLAALTLIALISAGCWNAPAETGTGSGGGNNTAAAPVQAVQFAQCLRDSGGPDFPDPAADVPLSDLVENREVAPNAYYGIHNVS